MGDTATSDESPEELANSALPRERVEQFLFECQQQPKWRREADRAADYYDGNQLDADTVDRLKDRGQPPLIANLIKPTIDTVLGMEAKSRSDWRVRPEDDDIANDDTAEALSLKLKHAETESRADRACSDAYAAQLKAGLGFVEVSRETDPLKYPYRVKAIHRREIFWDWRAELYDLSDARYLIRRRWLDLDGAIAMMPEYAQLFRQTTGAWAGFTPIMEQNTGLVQSWEIERDTRLEATDWRDMEHRRVCLSEIWYRKWVRGYVMSLPNGRTIEVDFDNPRHNQAIASGMVTVKMATFQKIRLAWYCGPHFLYDVPSPHKHGYFPYVPFFGYREDLTQVPYGLIRAMLSPQDEINARKSKMLWAMNSRRVITDSDAVKDHKQAAQEVSRPDAYVILDATRKPSSTFKVDANSDIAAQQFQVLQESKQEIAESSGIHKTMMGQTSSANSGLAINSLVEQGLNTLGEINDNFRFARRMVGEMLFSFVQEDLSGRPTRVTIGKGSSQKIVVLNMPQLDQQTGQVTMTNDVSKVRAKVVLDDIPSTPTFRMQQSQMLTEITKSLPPQAQTLIMDFVIESFDLPGGQKIADRLRKGLNLPDDSAEGQQAQAQAAQQQQAIQQQQLALEMREKQAKINQIEATTAKVVQEMHSNGGDSAAINAVRAEAANHINVMQGEMETLHLQLQRTQAALDQKTLVASNKETEIAASIHKQRIASAAAIEVAAIAHPVADLGAILKAVEALTAKVDSMNTPQTSESTS
ncbi:MAG: portal protein [Pseudomonadota bacterium]